MYIKSFKLVRPWLALTSRVGRLHFSTLGQGPVYAQGGNEEKEDENSLPTAYINAILSFFKQQFAAALQSNFKGMFSLKRKHRIMYVFVVQWKRNWCLQGLVSRKSR